MDAPYYTGSPVAHPSVESCDICGRETHGPCTATHFCDSCGTPTENDLDRDRELYCDRCAERLRLRAETDALMAEWWEAMR